MVLVELFDRETIENIHSILVFEPVKVIFVGSDKKRMMGSKERYEKLLESKGISTTLEFKLFVRSNFQQLLNVICEIIDENDEVSFDVKGGEDVVLFALGVAFERYRDTDKRINIHQVNLRTERVLDFGNMEYTPVNRHPYLTVSENILMHGGTVIAIGSAADNGAEDPLFYRPGEESRISGRWHFDAEFIRDIEVMWDMSRKESLTWNTGLNYLNELERIAGRPNNDTTGMNEGSVRGRRMLIPEKRIMEFKLNNGSDKATMVNHLLMDLYDAHLITELNRDAEGLKYQYKNSNIEHALDKAGNVLELVTYLAVLRAGEIVSTQIDLNGELSAGKMNPAEINEADNTAGTAKKVYASSAMEVVLGWDEKAQASVENANMDPSIREVENEIDVIGMQGVLPVFISCKNGNVAGEEIFKLNAAAERFGGKYAKKVLVATYLGKNEDSNRYLRQRAEDMRVKLIEGVHLLSLDELTEAIAKV